MDSQGRVIGLTLLGFRPAGIPTGINLFVPTRDVEDFPGAKVRNRTISPEDDVMAGPLEGQVALVAERHPRAPGRGIALELAAAGAKVYCTGRSTRVHPAKDGRPETIEETVELIAEAGGEAVGVRADHTDEADVEALAAQIRAESGRLDILVNDIWGGDELIAWGKPFWEQDIETRPARWSARRCSAT